MFGLWFILSITFHLSRSSHIPTIYCDKVNIDSFDSAYITNQTYTGGELDIVNLVFRKPTNFADITLISMEFNNFTAFPSALCANFQNLLVLFLNSNNFIVFTQDAFE